MMTLLVKSAAKSCLIVLVTVSMIQAQVDKRSQSQSQRSTGQSPTTSAESRTSTRIKGSVTEGGRPIADAVIFISPVNLGDNMVGAVTSMILRPNTSNADGKFEITSLAPGAYTISATAPGLVSSDSDAKIYRPGDTVTINLVKGGVITGTVKNSS